MTIHESIEVLKTMLSEDDRENEALDIAIACMEKFYEDVFVKS
ncbi:hypothetical protein [Alkalibaculum sporogenes]|nr:hypothetical protein [Alkalibaculum sporogenes]